MEGIVIGKRIPFGAIAGATISFFVWWYNARHPELQVPAEQAIGLSTIVTGLGQLWIVNRFGVTTK